MGALPPVDSFFWFAAVIGIVGGILLLVGLLSRPVAFLLSGEMAVIYWMIHAPKSTFPLENGGDAAILFCFIFLYIAAAGPGAWSVDESVVGKRKAKRVETVHYSNRASTAVTSSPAASLARLRTSALIGSR